MATHTDSSGRASCRSTVGELRARALAQLDAAPFDIERREAALLLGFVLHWNEAQVLARAEQPVCERDRERFLRMVERRRSGEPVAYLFGEREFYGRPFAVDRRVLIPRPETEHAVAAVLARNLAVGSRVLDVGCGSGCIALTLALERPDLVVFACDRSLGALAVARWNRWRLGLGQAPPNPTLSLSESGRQPTVASTVAASTVPLFASDLITAVEPRSLDLIVSNLPYVDPRDSATLSSEIRDNEPPLALYAERGVGLIERLLEYSRARLRAGAVVVLEIGAGQLGAVTEAARGFRVDRVHDDYAGHQRIVELVWSGQGG